LVGLVLWQPVNYYEMVYFYLNLIYLVCNDLNDLFLI